MYKGIFAIIIKSLLLELESTWRAVKAKVLWVVDDYFKFYCLSVENLGLVIIDYLQLMHSGKPQVGGFSKVQEVTDISNTLKTTAKELNIPIIALAQLNRNLMSRMGSNGKPVLSDLKDSGSIEQDADIVVFLHRPGLIGLSEDPDEQARTEVIFAKNRNGQVGSVNMRYVGHLMKFEDDNMSFYESAMNADSGTHAKPQNSYNQQIPNQMPNKPYNPFEEFDAANNEFVQ